MEPSDPAVENPPPSAAAPPAALPPADPPSGPPRDPRRWALLLGIAGTFLATLLGVFIAQILAERTQRNTEEQSYRTLLAVMHLDCRQALEKNRRLLGSPNIEPITQAAFLYVGALQNALLFRLMEPERLQAFVEAISDAAVAQDEYTHRRFMAPPPGAEDNVPPDLSEEKRQQWRAQVAEDRRRHRASLDEALNAYLPKQETLCELLAPAP